MSPAYLASSLAGAPVGLDLGGLAICVVVACWLSRGRWGVLIDGALRWGLVGLALLGAGSVLAAYLQIGRAIVLAMVGGKP